MLDADKLVEISFSSHGVVRLGDTEAHIEVKRGGWPGVMHSGIYPG